MEEGGDGIKLLRVLLCTALLSGVLFASAPAVSAACEQVWVDNYNIVLELDRHSYRMGDTVDIGALVTRKTTGDPVWGADFAVLLISRKDTFTFAIDETDASGRAEVALKLKRKFFAPGPVRLRALAMQAVADTTCATVGEYGIRKVRRAFVVRP